MKKVDWKRLALCLAIPLAVGGLAGWLTRGDVEVFSLLRKPPLSPPGSVFPIVWAALYALMGVSSYLVCRAHASPLRSKALTIYAAQLVANFCWPLLFFSLQAYLLAFLELVLLWILALVMLLRFGRLNPLAARLQIPYLLWLTFAGYLNLGIYLLNR